ncbi:MAG: adenylate kinase [Acidimicrobiales bacterium]|nr:adenylate kinase [Acidimicrobiales bacterium]
MIPGARLVMLGRQGAGKGTQCTRLSRHFVVPHISTGDMLRAAVKEGTEFGNKAKEYMSAGELLPDDIIIGIVEERLLKDDTRNRGYILDGFPRTKEQAESLAEITAHQPLDMVVDLDVPTDVVLERLASRRVCTDCGANYSVQQPPKHNWSCDHCGGEVIQRADDTEDAIKRRLALYEEETAPLVEWYRTRGLLTVVDGHGDADEVTGRLIRAIEARAF